MMIRIKKKREVSGRHPDFLLRVFDNLTPPVFILRNSIRKLNLFSFQNSEKKLNYSFFLTEHLRQMRWAFKEIVKINNGPSNKIVQTGSGSLSRPPTVDGLVGASN